MPHLKSLSIEDGPPAIFEAYPEIYGPWSHMSEALMNGPSPLTRGEREMILAYTAGLGGCQFVYVAHSEVAYAHGIENGLIETLIQDPELATVGPRLRPMLAFIRKLVLTPEGVSQVDAEEVFNAGWDEHALHDAIAVAARAGFMQRLVQGLGFTPMTRQRAAQKAKQRIEHGYVNLYSAFRNDK